MTAEINTNFEGMGDEVLTVVHALVEVQAEALPVEEFKEYTATINATIELNYQLFKLIQYPQKTIATLDTINNRINPPNPLNLCNPSNALNSWNCRHCSTRKYFWSHGSCYHTSMDLNI